MALKTLRYVDIHIPFKERDEGTVVETVPAIAEGLMEFFDKTRAGEFTADELRPDEVVLSFESKKPAQTLAYVQKLLTRHGLARGSFAWVHDDIVPSDASLRIPMEDLDLWLKRLERVSTATGKTRGRSPRVNDYYAVPLPDGRFGHLQFVHRERKQGDLVQVFSVITSDHPASLEQLRDAEPLFPPVRTMVIVGVSHGGWIYLGNRPPAEVFRHPTFRNTDSLLFCWEKPGMYTDWWLWSGGDKSQFVGKLTEDQRRLEYNVMWSPESIARRIMTGENEYDRFY